jgi:hypothetical protein
MRSDGNGVALNKQRIIHFSIQKGMKIISEGQFLLYIENHISSYESRVF